METTESNHTGSAVILDEPAAPRTTRRQEFWRIFRKNRMAIAGLLIFLIFFMIAVFGLISTSGTRPLLDPSLVRLQEKLRPPMTRAQAEVLKPSEIPPFGVYLFGTDDLGRDVFARMMQGAWVSLTVGFVAVGISVIIGIFLGGVAGFYGSRHIRSGHLVSLCLLAAGGLMLIASNVRYGVILAAFGLFLLGATRHTGKTPAPAGRGLLKLALHGRAVTIDTVIMRFVDIMLCFPSFFLILTVVALLPASIYNIMIVIGLTSWMGTTRFVRAEFLSLREQDFVAAAKVLAVGNMRIIFRHMMPNAVAPVLVSATIGIATAILTEAGLSFLGFGVPPPHATWGNILSDGKRFIFDAPWLTFIPGIAILIVVLSFNLFGEGLRDALNPKLRERQ
jgi:peptide/nickel transport system permease protein